MDFFKNIKKYWKFSLYSAKCDLNTDVGNLRLGWLWWILEPVLFMCVYAAVFSIVFGRQMQYLMAYISGGIMLWNFFNRSVLNSVTLVKRYSGMLNRVYIPKYVLVFSNLLLNLFKMLISFLIVLAFMIIYRIPFNISMLLSIPVVAVFMLLTFGISVWLLHFGVYLPDLKKVTPVVLQVLFYMSGVFYSLKGKLEEIAGGLFVKLNPTGVLMYEVRNLLFYGGECAWDQVLIWLVVGLILSVTGVKMVIRHEADYLKVI